jgi:spore coat polysaccharide biosynthesis protein SpsF (cytidylyltransferase family)
MAVTAAIIQARMGSTRLPGKVMQSIGRRTVLEECLSRCRAIPGVDVVCCATVETAEGEEIVAAAERLGCIAFRGSETDVLARYAGAARAVGADRVLRVTSDCPFTDPVLCGDVLALLAESGCDYTANNAPASYPHGLDCEVVSADWLFRAEREGELPGDREHVTPFVRRHPDCRRVNLRARADETGHAALRLTVDYPEDLAFTRALAAALDGHPVPESWRSIVEILARDPALAALNRSRIDHARLSAAAPVGFRQAEGRPGGFVFLP